MDPRESIHVLVKSPRGGYVRVRHEQFEYVMRREDCFRGVGGSSFVAQHTRHRPFNVCAVVLETHSDGILYPHRYRYNFEFVPHPKMSHKKSGRYFVKYRRNAYIRQYVCCFAVSGCESLHQHLACRTSNPLTSTSVRDTGIFVRFVRMMKMTIVPSSLKLSESHNAHVYIKCYKFHDEECALHVVCLHFSALEQLLARRTPC